MFGVIFDMDGTLLDTQSTSVPAWEHAGRIQGYDGVGSCIYKICGMNKLGWSKYLLALYPDLDIERFSSDVAKYINEHLVVKYKPGGKEILDFLREKGIKMGLASGSNREVAEKRLSAVEARDYFDAVVAGTEVENGKPAPDIFLLTAEKMGISPEKCFVIEDSPNGIRAGQRAGMKCIGIPDVVEFEDEIKAILYSENTNFFEVIQLFEELLQNGG